MVRFMRQPPLMRFYEALEPPATVSPALIEEIVQTQDWGKVS
jgi:hypothetical protein